MRRVCAGGGKVKGQRSWLPDERFSLPTQIQAPGYVPKRLSWWWRAASTTTGLDVAELRPHIIRYTLRPARLSEKLYILTYPTLIAGLEQNGALCRKVRSLGPYLPVMYPVTSSAGAPFVLFDTHPPRWWAVSAAVSGSRESSPKRELRALGIKHQAEAR